MTRAGAAARWPSVGADPVRPPDFDTEIVPVLTKAGCNAGACHGAAAGRGGFQLSLFGSDPAADYDAIVQELEGRRVNLARPGREPDAQQADRNAPPRRRHATRPGRPGAKRLADWIAAGAPRAKTARRLTAFESRPASKIVDREGAEVRLTAVARFDDGPAEDVTAWTVFTPTDPSAVETQRRDRAPSAAAGSTSSSPDSSTASCRSG